MPEQLEDLLGFKKRVADKINQAFEEGGYKAREFAAQNHKELGLPEITIISYISFLRHFGDLTSKRRIEAELRPERLQKTRKFLRLLDTSEDDPLIIELDKRYASLVPPSQPSQEQYPPRDSPNRELNHESRIPRKMPTAPSVLETERRLDALRNRAESLYTEGAIKEYLAGCVRRYKQGNAEQKEEVISELEGVINAHAEQKIHDRKVT